MVRRKRDVAIIVWRCVIIGFGASVQQAAFGAATATPSKQVGSDTILGVQEIKNVDAPAEPQAVMQEVKSTARLSGSKQRRRKPKMAGVPSGPQAVAQETKESGPQAVARETKESEPQAEVQETKESGQQERPLAWSGGVKVKPQGAPKADASQKRYGMAPIQWGGRITETVSFEQHSQTAHGAAGSSTVASSGSRGIIHAQTADILARTYFLKPYIAQLAGNIGVLSSRNTMSTYTANTIGLVSNINSTTNNSSKDAVTRSNSLFGSSALSLFPQSRFPFAMSLGIENGHSKLEYDTQNTERKYIKLLQSYQQQGSNSHYTGGYSYQTLTTNTSWGGLNAIPKGVATNSAWIGDYSNFTPEHKIFANLKFNQKQTSSVSNISNRTDDFWVRDFYMPSESLLSLTSSATLNSFAGSSSSSRYLLANTRATWQPEEEDIPLFVDGNVHLFKQLGKTGDVGTAMQSLGGDVGALYRYSRNLSGRVDGSLTSSSRNGDRSVDTVQRGGATYNSDAIKIWKNSSYSWRASGSAINQNVAATRDSYVTGDVGHVLSVPNSLSMFGTKFFIRSTVNQSLHAHISRFDDTYATLNNSGNVTGGLGEKSGTGTAATSATLEVRDVRTVGQRSSHYQTYSLVLRETGGYGYSKNGLAFNVSVRAVQGTKGSSVGLFGSGSGTATYNKSRVFNVRGLNYSANLSVFGTESKSTNETAGNVARNPRFPWYMDHKLTYKIGQNEVTLKGVLSDGNGVKNASLWMLFKAWRTIGN